MPAIDPETFINLNAPEVASLMREAGPQVCVLPICGSQRWLSLEHGQDEAASHGLDAICARLIELLGMCFAHGLGTLIIPLPGLDLAENGDDHQQTTIDCLARLAIHPDFISFYQKQDVRVYFYGDYRKKLANTPNAYLCDLFERLSLHTAGHTCRRIFFGLFAGDCTETIAEMSARHHMLTGQVPDRAWLVGQYYGAPIDKVDLFIGFEKFNVYDYPMLGSGHENLYFAASPSFYLDEKQLRQILYDHLYLRPLKPRDCAGLSDAALDEMRNYYRRSQGVTFGVGQLRSGAWSPGQILPG